MLFNSIEFLLFFPTVVAIYFLLPARYRWALLLGASYYFYMAWKPEYVLLLVFSTLVDFYCGRQMGRMSSRPARRLYLVVSLISNLGVLFAFKYFNFFNESARTLFDSLNIFYGVPAFHVLLPVGISFYTFQTLGYSIDVYRGRQQAETHLGHFALYVSFFPQLVAGPIERASNLLPQFYQRHNFDYARVVSGLRLMAWGFFKKVVIADQLAVAVDTIYGNPQQYTGFLLVLATYFFAYQIYCDFSGYSDIAIGTARVLGFDLMKNFDQPYLSSSLPEFWRRWHISLSTWFRDYLYIPLGGNRISVPRWYINLFVVFVVSGLWHGANWTFVIWGALHGIYVVVWTVITRWQSQRIMVSGHAESSSSFGSAPVFAAILGAVPVWLKNRENLGSSRKLPSSEALAWIRQAMAVVFSFHLVTFAWIFFRARTLSDAFYIVTHLFTDFKVTFSWGLGLGKTLTVMVVLCTIFMETVEWIYRRQRGAANFDAQPSWFRWSFYYAVIMLILLFGNFNSNAQFIYFQF